MLTALTTKNVSYGADEGDDCDGHVTDGAAAATADDVASDV